MRRGFAKFFLLLFTFHALVPMRMQEDIAKISALVGHYQEHLAENPGLSLAAFLQMHYGSGYAQHQSAHDHNQLPGKHHDGAHFTCSCVSIVPTQTCLTTRVAHETPCVHKQIIEKAQISQSQYLNSIWQPPRTVLG